MEGETNSGFTIQDEENSKPQELNNTVPSEKYTPNPEEHRIGINEDQSKEKKTRFRRNIPLNSLNSSKEENSNEITPVNENCIGATPRNNDENKIAQSPDKINNTKQKCNQGLLRSKRNLIFYVILNGCILAYFIIAIIFWVKEGNCEFDWCDGLGMLLLILAFTYFGFIYYYVIKKYFSSSISKAFKPIGDYCNKFMKIKYIKLAVYLLPLAAAIIYIIVDTIGSSDRLISCLGLFVIFALGFIFSKHPRKIIWRPVMCGLGIQFLMGLLTIRWSVGRSIFLCIGDKVTIFLGYADEGSKFVYGVDLIKNNIFAFKALSTIFFICLIVEILYYLGAMQIIVIKLGWILQTIMGTTICESINASASVFLGMSEAPILVKPYLKDLTRSEMHAVMTGGFATVAGSVLGAYISFGVSAAHLITASVMSAPAALCYAKLFYPETEESKNKSSDIIIEKEDATSVLDAATKGALVAVQLVLGIIANIIAFVAFVAFLNGVLSWLGMLVGLDGFTFEYILSKVFIPLAWLMGVQYSECEDVARLIGLKTVVNEFVAYEQLGKVKATKGLSPRSEMIATYALCGFSNPGSIGILIGSLATMAPQQRSKITEVAYRAFIAGSATCFITACIAGILMPDDYYYEFSGNRTMPDDFYYGFTGNNSTTVP